MALAPSNLSWIKGEEPTNNTTFKEVPDVRKPMNLLRTNDVCECLNICRATIYNWINPNSKYHKPDFPKPIRLSERTVAWSQDEITDYISKKIES